MNSTRHKAYLYLFIVTLIWGAASPVIKYTLGGLGPMTFLAYRFAISAAIAVLFLFFSRTRIVLKPKILLLLILYSLFSTTFSLGFLFIGLEKTTVLHLSLVSLTGPLLLSIAGAVFLKEHVTKREKIGTFIAFLGALLTVIEPIATNSSNLATFEGNILITLYLLFDISSVIFLKILLRNNFSPQILINVSFIIGFLTLLPLILVTTDPTTLILTITNLSLPYHLGVLYMAVLSGTLAYWLRARAQKTIKVEQTAIFGYLMPVFSVPFAVFWLQESISPETVVGAIVIMMGVAYTKFKFKHE